MAKVGIALGSNLGDRLSNLKAAVSRLREIAVGNELTEAPVYQTAPLLCPPDSPDFLNTVVEMSYAGTAFELLETTLALERELGRMTVTERNAPRVIDLDLLYFGEALIDTENLVIPHPRIAGRRFVLEPLAAIRPTLVLPGQKRTISELLVDLGECEKESATTE